jgi:RNA polymerase sigma-70 factor (ECF subfamily)
MQKAKPTHDISEVEDILPDDKLSLAEMTDKTFTQQAVRGAIETLPVGYRQVVALYYWDNFNYEEIAEIINRPVGTVRTWLHRAKEELRKELYGQI